MSRRVRAILTVAACVSLAGCYTIRYERRAAPEGGAPREQWHHGLLGGILDVSGPVKLAETCPDGFATVEHQTTFFNWFGQVVTGGRPAPLWEPTTVRVRCARPSVAGRALKVVVLPLTALGEAGAEAVRLDTEALAGELRRRPGISVLTDADLAALLGVEKRRQMVTGCSDAGCLAEIGGALGADRVIHGTVGKVGGSLLVNLTSLDARKSRGVASVSERLRAGDEAFLDALPAMVDRLLAEPVPAPQPPGAPPRK